MNITRKYDLSVVVANYTDEGGRSRRRYQTIGTLCETDTGPVIWLDATFNPAAIPRKPESRSILISCYPQDEADRGEQV